MSTYRVGDYVRALIDQVTGKVVGWRTPADTDQLIDPLAEPGKRTVAVDAITSVNATSLGLVDDDVLIARGLNSASDLLGGEYVYDAESTAPSDPPNVVVPAVGAGRFLAVKNAALADPDGAALVGSGTRTVAAAIQQINNNAPSSQFDLLGNQYAASDDPGATRAAHRFVATSSGTHTHARSGIHTEIHAEGSGAESGPERADFAQSMSIFKKDWNYTYAVDGELDTLNLTGRQGNGDHCLILGNLAGHNGFFGFLEARVESIWPSDHPTTPNQVKHSVNVTQCIVNDRDDDYRGVNYIKQAGLGGIAFSTQVFNAANWDKIISVGNLAGAEVFQLSGPTDNRITWLDPDDTSKGVRLSVDGNECIVTSLAGGIVGARFPDPLATWSPTATPVSGSFVGSATVTAPTFSKSGKWVWGDVEVTLPADIGSASGHLVIPTPTTPAAGRTFTCSGYSLNTGQTLSVAIYSDALRIRTYDGAFPGTGGHTISVSFRYREA